MKSQHRQETKLRALGQEMELFPHEGTQTTEGPCTPHSLPSWVLLLRGRGEVSHANTGRIGSSGSGSGAQFICTMSNFPKIL